LDGIDSPENFLNAQESFFVALNDNVCKDTSTKKGLLRNNWKKKVAWEKESHTYLLQRDRVGHDLL